MFETDAFGDDIKKIYPVINEDGSDSAMLDNYLNMLTLSGIPMAQAVMMAIPEPWENDESMDPDKRLSMSTTLLVANLGTVQLLLHLLMATL